MEAAQTRFITDSEGHRTDVVLSLSEYEKLMEDLHDLAVIAARRDEPTVGSTEIQALLEPGDGADAAFNLRPPKPQQRI